MTAAQPSATPPATTAQERRHHARIAFRAPAQLVIGSRTIAVSVLDLSLKGALLALPTDCTLEEGAICRLHVQLDGSNGQISMDARLAHVAPGHAGIVCLLIDIDSATHLRRLVELNLGDPALLERELSALIAE